MAKSKQEHEADITRTLRGLVHVQPLSDNVLVANEDFWSRCDLVNPNWRHESAHPTGGVRIYVDGFVGACKWNSWRVLVADLEPGVRIYQGYALGLGSWAEHCWCMLGNRIIETCGEFDIYYGAELTATERAILQKGVEVYDPLAHTAQFWTVAHRERLRTQYNAAEDAAGIGRERNLTDREIKPGLGH